MNACGEYQTKFEGAIADASEEFKQQVSILSQEAEKDAKSLEDEAPEGAEIALGVDFTVEPKLTTWSINLPQFKLVDKKVASLDIPEVTVKNRDITFHTPSTKMVLKTVGKYPEVKCELRGIRTKCKTVWKEIKTHVPEVFMQEQKIIMGIPEVTMETQEVILGLPEVDWKPVQFKFDLPEIKIEKVEAKTKKIEKKSKKLKIETERKIEDEKAEFKAEIIENVAPFHTAFFDCLKQEALTGIETGIIMIEGNIKSSVDTIENLRRGNVPADHQAFKQLEETKRLLSEQKAKLEQEKGREPRYM